MQISYLIFVCSVLKYWMEESEHSDCDSPTLTIALICAMRGLKLGKIWLLFSNITSLCPYRWSFSRGRSLQMIICKRPVPSDDHFQEAELFGWSFSTGRSLGMISCEGPVPSDDHVLLKRRSFWIIICKRPFPSDDHLQEASPFGQLFARSWSLQMIIC